MHFVGYISFAMVTDLPPIHRSIGRIIHYVRLERGMRQAELALLTGLKQPNLSRIENGLVIPRASTLEKVALALSVNLKELLSEDKVREVETKWGAALSPRNAGQLIAGKLLATPFYPLDAESGPAWRGPMSARPILTLQLPTIFIKAGVSEEDDEDDKKRGRGVTGPVIFALRWWDNSMNAADGAQPSFSSGDILVFCSVPDPLSGDLVLAITPEATIFRRMEFVDNGASYRFTALNPSFSARTVAKNFVQGIWRLAGRMQVF